VADAAAQVLGLPPLPGSPSRARAFVREVLGRWSLAHLADDASVVVTELATNVLLHARTDFVVTVERSRSGVRLSVRDSDRSPVLLPVSVAHPPANLLEDDDDLDALEQLLNVSATTGRGLRPARRPGEQLGGRPRRRRQDVWAVLGDGSSEPAAHIGGRPAAGAPAPQGPTVSLVALPVRLALESDLNLDALVREFQVMEGSGTASEAGALVTAAREVLATYAAQRAAGRRVAHDAAARGDRLVDVEAEVPEGAPAALHGLVALLEVVDEHCRSGRLLALAASAELQAFRRWYADEVSRQVDGAPPRPCPFPVVPLPADRQDGPVVLGPAEQDRLAALARAVAAAPTAEEAARLVLGACVDALGVSRASVCLLDPPGGQLRIVASHGYPEVVTRHWGSFPVTADLPASEAVRTGRPVVLRTLAEREERYPALSATPVLQSPSLACVPLLPGEPPAAGVLNLSFERSRDFSARDLQLLAELARTATPALLRDA
jgi:hypothetical protein